MPPRRGPAAPPATRIDPADGKAYTFNEVSEKYSSQYSAAQIRSYWNTDMRPAQSEAAVASPGDREEETRVDPDDGKSYSFSGLAAKYAGQYSEAELRRYWRNDMQPARPAAASSAPATDGAAAATPGAAAAATEPAAAEDLVGKAKELRVSFCPDPKTIGEKFTLTYDKAPSSNFASVNPGDQGLRVGGSTLNGQFQKDLYNLAWQETEKYGAYHSRLFGMSSPQLLTRAGKEVLALNPNLMAGFVFKAADGSKVGTAFVDIFRSEVRVHKHPMNVGMVYTVGPKRQDLPNDQAFLSQVEATARNVCLACTAYNSLAAPEGLPRIDVLRFPLVSGGAFAGRCPKDAVAAVLIRGLLAGCAADTPEMNFAFDGDIFRRTWEGMKA